jgi:hypothetical protein
MVSGQERREVQVPLDPGLGILEMDAGLRRELALFPEVPDFVAARLFQGADGELVLEVSYRAEGRLARSRRPLGEDELAAFRAELRARLEASGRTRVVSRDGRAGLIVGQTVVGLGWHGWAVPTALGIDSDRGAVATYLLTAGASFLVPWLVTERVPVSVAERDASFWGATRGIAYGALLGDLIVGDGDAADGGGGRGQDDPRTQLALGSVVSLLGSILGYQAVERFDADPGRVALWSAAGDFGLGGAFLASWALGLYDDDLDCELDFCTNDGFEGSSAGHAVTLGLGAASLWGAKLWSEREDYTVGDARALRSFGFLGAQSLLPLSVQLADGTQGDAGDRLVAASALAGAAAGLWLGNRTLRRTSLTGGEGLLVLAGHLAGGLGALGLTYLLDAGGDADAPVYLGTSAAGSVLGSLLTFRAVSR